MSISIGGWQTDEYDYPNEARKDGAEDCRAFGIRRDATQIGVLTALEPFMDDGSTGRHVSISKSHCGAPCEVTRTDIAIVWAMLAENGIERPAQHETVPFANGPFRGLGKHLWELPAEPQPPHPAT